MKAHHVLFPILLVVGVGECAALNMVAGRTTTAAATECPEPPKCPPSTPASATPREPGTASGTTRDEGVAAPPPKPSANTAAPDGDEPAGNAPPPDAIRLPFAPQSALFDPNARREMFKIARAMKDDPNKKIKLIGNSDLETDGDRAESLPERRAKSCHDFIIQLGVERDRVSYETRPPSKSTSAAESGQNRAVTALWQ